MSRKDANRRDGPIGDDELDGLFGAVGGPLALAVSGGADSMALMHLAARWQRASRSHSWTMTLTVDGSPQRPRRAVVPVPAPPWLAHIRDADQLESQGGPPQLVVLTVDHGLRPGSGADAEFVADEARKLGLPCQILRWEGPKPATGIQDAARQARRRLLLEPVAQECAWVNDLLARGGRTYLMNSRSIVMAHHADDQAETFLMRLARGSGLDGLSAIRSPDDMSTDGLSGRVVRPLLGVPKARLRATLEAAGLPWRDDPSNENTAFERIRIRKALAVLEDLGVGATAIAASARRLGDARLAYRAVIADGPARSIAWHDGLMAQADLSRQLPNVRVHLMQGMLAAMGGGSPPPQLSQIEALGHRLSGGLVETLGGCCIETDGDLVTWVYRETGRGLPTVELRPGESKHWDGDRFFVAAAADAPEPAVTVGALGADAWADLKRAVPGLADQQIGGRRLPAAAVAGLPAYRAKDGILLAVPWLDELLLRAGADEARGAWRRLLAAPTGRYSALFTGDSRQRWS